MEARDINKLYYSISEVSLITELKQYVLRFWEIEFSQLKPKKNSAGNRIYRSNDIDKILEIKSLLYERKFTIKGAQQYLKRNHEKNNIPIADKKNNIIKMSNSLDNKLLKDLKHGLNDLIKLINQFKD